MNLRSSVLVVDDNLNLRQALESLLITEGYDVACAGNGAEALAKAAQLTPDLILLDVMMPDMDGFEVCQRLRADPLLAEIPVIMVTALADRDSRLQGFEAGADDFLSKPIDTPELLARVRTTTRLNRYRRLLVEQDQRQQAEAALRESERKHRELYENLRDGSVAVDMEGRFTEFNRTYQEMLGYSAEEMSRLAYQDITPVKWHSIEARIIEEQVLKRGYSDLYEKEYVRKDGTIFPVELRAYLIRDNHGTPTGMWATVRDITERRQAEKALRDSERRYRLLIENTPTVTWATGQDGKTTFISFNVEEVYGYSPDEILEAGEALWFDRIHPKDRDRVKDGFESLFSKQGEFDIEYRIQRKDGNWIWLHDRANIVEEREGNPHAYGVFSDITERKQAEEALQRYAERLEILHEIDQGILAAQSPETIAQAALGRIRQLIPCQRAGVTLFDYAANEAIVLAVNTDIETEPGASSHFQLESFEDEFELWRRGQVAIWREPGSRSRNIQVLLANEKTGLVVSVPLITQGELIGCLSLSYQTSNPNVFGQEQKEIARQVADQLAIAIQQARLHEQAERHAEELEQRVADRTRELSVLYEVAALASQSLGLETTLARSLAAALGAVDSSAGAIHLLDEVDETPVDGATDGEMLRMAVQQGIPRDLRVQIESLPPDKGLGKWVAGQDKLLIIPDIAMDPRVTVTPPIEPQAYVGVRLRSGGRTSGVLSVLRGTDQPRFRLEELSLLTSVADQLGIVVESARLRKGAERTAVLEERERLARDLHDSVTQLLYSVNLFARSARNAHNLGDTDELHHCLTELGKTGQQALKEMRLMVYELRPRALEQEGLIGAIQHRLDAVEGRVGVVTQLSVGETVELPERMEQDLYHITIEALNNTLKYAKATSVTVSLEADRERIRLEVTDDGAGFDPGAVKEKGGLGIVGIRERAERLGGTLQVISTPGKGTSVRVEIAGTHRNS